jgi:hypothetical protein
MTTTWENYERWNEAVVDVVLPELEVPQPVYLDFEDEVLEGLGTRMGLAPDQVEDALTGAVAATLPHLGPASIFERHMTRTRAWVRGRREGKPPFVALLAAFCIAAEQMAAGDGMASSNFFGRLRAVLGWDPEDHRLDQGYRRVAERLWGELNRWLVELDGQRGLPTAYALNHRFVGLTVSQALVRSADRERLKTFFRQYGFAPGADVAPSELGLVLDSWIGQQPCPVSTTLARLWTRGQARDRIAQSAAVALAGWDGSVRVREGESSGEAAARGSVALTLEMGGFPRKRFAVQALFYLPEPGQARQGVVQTATPETTIDLVPALPGALGLALGSSLHAGDVLGGVLKIKDELTGQVLERRPRRLVLFREDELSRRWIESPQVMLGDSVRLLVHESLLPRLREVLDVIARPGWEQVEAYPGQPGGWVVVSGVEVFNHPGGLVSNEKMDDLAPLVPLTSSQLKVAGGFALPGQVRGKWHSWEPPEVRAVSDASGGFVVRVVDTRRFVDDPEDEPVEELLAEWSDDGTGVVVRSLAALELEDGDYRVELVAKGDHDPLTTTMVLLRSADTPDHRQWSLLDPVSYGPGLGVLGVQIDGAPQTRGHLVASPLPCPEATVDVPLAPGWSTGPSASSRAVGSVVRLTMPDADSCVYTGRHREWIDTVPTDARGKPLQAWAYGRCRSCGLVRRYPTRLRRSSFRGRSVEEPQDSGTRHDLAGLAPAATSERSWATAFDALLHTGGGSWSQLERIAYQIEPTALFLDQLARTLEVLGHLDVRRDHRTLEPTAWEVTPTALSRTEAGYLFAGYWPASIYGSIGSALEDDGLQLAVDEPADAPASYYVECDRSDLDRLGVSDQDVVVVEEPWQDLISVLPPLSELLEQLPREPDVVVGDISWYQPRDNTWLKVSDLGAPGAYRVRRFATLDVVRTAADVESGTMARSTVQLGKHLAALIGQRPLLAYDPSEKLLTVPLGADLPGLYGRAAVAASGRPPVAVGRQRVLRYEEVPVDLARHLYRLLTS